MNDYYEFPNNSKYIMEDKRSGTIDKNILLLKSVISYG